MRGGISGSPEPLGDMAALIGNTLGGIISFIVVSTIVVLVVWVGGGMLIQLGWEFLKEKLKEARNSPTRPTDNIELEASQIEPEPVVEEEPEPMPIEEPPPPPDSVLMGTDADTNKPIYMDKDLRGKHLYLIGKTRTGKTTLIKNLIVQTMEHGDGLAVIDPHGDMAEEVLTHVPKHRVKDVIYFDPMQPWCPAFNPLALPYPTFKLVTDIISVFKLFFGDSWGYRMDYIFRMALNTLIFSKHPTSLLDLHKILTNEKHREYILAALEPDSKETEEMIDGFWQDQFPRQSGAVVDPIINKLSQFLAPASPMLRVFSQPENGLNFPQMLREQKILIVNLAKGEVGSNESMLLGGAIVAGIQGAALAQVGIAKEKRKPFHFFIDEFQNYATKSMEEILSESAKYKLFLTLAHQTLGQGEISPALTAAIFGNVATLVSFQISSLDAPTMAREMKRTRVLVRQKGASSTVDPDDFIAGIRKELTTTLKGYRASVETDDYAPYNQMEFNKVQNMLAMLDDPTTTLEAIKERIMPYKVQIWWAEQVEISAGGRTANRMHHEAHPLFPSYDFKTTSYPDVGDFVNMEMYHAFIRKEKAENVTYIKTNAPPPPVAGIKGQILHNMRELHAERQQPQPPPPPKKSNVIPLHPEAESTGLADGVTITKQPALQNPPRKPQKEKLTF